jgi:hypothetical protein
MGRNNMQGALRLLTGALQRAGIRRVERMREALRGLVRKDHDYRVCRRAENERGPM